MRISEDMENTIMTRVNRFNEPLHLVGADVPESYWLRLKELAKTERVYVSDILRELIRERIEQA